MRRRNNARLILLAATLVVISGSPVAYAATTLYLRPTAPDVFITEVQTASNTSGGEEFIELYNASNSDIDFADTAHAGKDAWKLQYFSTSKLASLLTTSNWASPYRTINLSGTIPAHDYYVLASTGYNPASITPDQSYGSTLADDGGALQLIDTVTTGSTANVTIHDQLAWSTDKTLPAASQLQASPGAGSSLQRLPNASQQYINADGSMTAFTHDIRLSPENAWTPTPVTDPVDSGGGSKAGSIGSTSTANAGLPLPIITELLPNPASPQTDEANEYIELYNPGDSSFDLTGYSLETGIGTLHDFTFVSGAVLAPHSYRVFYSAETGLSLSNSGGAARLLDKNGTILSASASYTAAADGEAWALDDSGNWQWTTRPTPGSPNVIQTPVPTAAKPSVVKPDVKKIADKVTGKTSTRGDSKKTSQTSTPKKSTATKQKKVKKPAASANLASDTTTPVAPIHPAVLVAVGLVAVGYGVYEYRTDIANKYSQFRADRAARRKARS